MPINKNALIRYKTIDKCLQNRYRKWTLDDLIASCSDALYEYEGKDCNVSKRTVQLDIYNMRSEKLGYNAPIIVVDKKYYSYQDANYSITNLPISSLDLEKLAESVTFLKQFKGFSHFDALNGVIQKLEDHVYSKQTQTKPIIEFEKNENLKGLHFLDELYQTILQKKAIEITYKSFKARSKNSFVFHGYLLKEFRNRWFVIGVRNKEKHLINLALDRIVSLQKTKISYQINTTHDLENYYSKAIGVSVSPNLKIEKTLLFIYHKHAPYVETKPFHSSQKVIDRNMFGITISLDIQHNFELERDILAFGEGVRVIAPSNLKRRIESRLLQAVSSYQSQISAQNLDVFSEQFHKKGSTIINQVFSLRALKQIFKLIAVYERKLKQNIEKLPNLITKIPILQELLINKNIQKIIQKTSPNAVLINSVYYKKYQEDLINKAWFQYKNSDYFIIRVYLKEFYKTDYLAVILGSHNKTFTPQEIDLLVSNSIRYKVFVKKGGIQLIDHITLRKWVVQNPKKQIAYIDLVYKKQNIS